jgi:phenylacetate-CoA ligase
MILSEKIRQAAFWGIDFIKGSPIARHIKDLKKAFSDVETGKERAAQRLDDILKHAVSTTAFYKKFAGFKKLEDFPVIQKKTIKDNYDDFLSSAYNKSKLVIVRTSGSYGAPFAFCLTKNKKARMQAEIIFFSGWAGYRVGMKYAQIRAHPRSRLLLFMQNGLQFNPTVIDDVWLKEKRNYLKAKKILFIIGYTSAIKTLAQYCRNQGDCSENFALVGVITGAETLLDSDRQLFKAVFGCPVLDRYSANELGVISHECSDYKTHHINLATHKVELLRLDSNEPVEVGEVGRVIITDLFSHAMPLIRYDTGDLAIWGGSCKCGLDTPTFERIRGRVVELIYDPEGNTVNPLAIVGKTEDLTGVIEIQFIQKTSDLYLIKMHVAADFAGEDVVRQRYQRMLGPKAKINFEYVDSIPVLSSGKKPFVINEYKRSDG